MFTLPTMDQVPCEVISYMLSLFLILFPTPHSCKVNINPIRQMKKLKVEKFTHSNRKLFPDCCTVEAPFRALWVSTRTRQTSFLIVQCSQSRLWPLGQTEAPSTGKSKNKGRNRFEGISKVPFWRYVQRVAYWMAIGHPNRDSKQSEIYESSKPQTQFVFHILFVEPVSQEKK